MNYDWRKVLAREKAATGEEPNLFSYWCGRYFMEKGGSGQADAFSRAEAFAYTLEHLSIRLEEGQMFLGGPALYSLREKSQTPTDVPLEKGLATAEARCGLRPFQAAANHTVPDYRTLMSKGLPDFLKRAEAAYAADPTPYRQAMLVCLKAFRDFLQRAARELAATDAACAARLAALAERAPQDFHEGLQLLIIVHTLLKAQGGDADALGRLDQYMWPLYEKSALPHEEALEAVCQVFSFIYHGAVTNIAIGGVTPEGENAANDLSLLIMEAVDRVHIPTTNLSARVSRASTDEFLLACIDLISTGIGFPAIFNDHVNIPMLQNSGIPLEAARDYALVGCVEVVVPGRQVPWSDGRFNMPGIFCDCIEHLADCPDFETFLALFDEKLNEGVRKYAADYEAYLAQYPVERFSMPFLSALVRDCIGRGRDVNDGGPEFPRFHGIGMMGLGTIADSLAAVKKLVFEEKRLTPAQLLQALHDNFQGHDIIHGMVRNCVPKYGNDDPYVDSLAAKVVDICSRAWANMRFPDGGRYFSCMGSNINNIPAGRETPATPDGRLAGEPLSDAASVCCGCDREGTTALINSITTPDYSEQNCTVVNVRFLPDMLKGEAGRQRMLAVLRKFIAGGGHEIQFNVTDNGVLEQAVAEPEKYADLVVRVSGFSGYFTRLSPAVQKDILRRNIHAS